MKKIEVAARIMEHLCTHDGDSPGHGYSQKSRWGDGGTEKLIIGGMEYTIATGDRDCSAATIDALRTAGIPTGKATVTANMKAQFLSTGAWEWHPMGSGYEAKRGDVYLKGPGHAAMCKSRNPDMLMQFSRSEKNSKDGKEGDQTGKESNIRTYYNYPWDGILTYVGNEDADAPKVEQPASKHQVKVDGYLGKKSIKALQTVAGTIADGVMSGQDKENEDYTYRIIAQTFEGTGKSQLAKWMQKRSGAKVDGIFGPKSVAAWQKHMNKETGSKLNGDCWFGPKTAKVTQKWTNKKLQDMGL